MPRPFPEFPERVIGACLSKVLLSQPHHEGPVLELLVIAAEASLGRRQPRVEFFLARQPVRHGQNGRLEAARLAQAQPGPRHGDQQQPRPGRLQRPDRR